MNPKNANIIQEASLFLLPCRIALNFCMCPTLSFRATVLTIYLPKLCLDYKECCRRVLKCQVLRILFHLVSQMGTTFATKK